MGTYGKMVEDGGILSRLSEIDLHEEFRGFQPSGFIYSEDQHSDMGISTSQKMIGKSAPTSRPDLAVTKKKHSDIHRSPPIVHIVKQSSLW